MIKVFSRLFSFSAFFVFFYTWNAFAHDSSDSIDDEDGISCFLFYDDTVKYIDRLLHDEGIDPPDFSSEKEVADALKNEKVGLYIEKMHNNVEGRIKDLSLSWKEVSIKSVDFGKYVILIKDERINMAIDIDNRASMPLTSAKRKIILKNFWYKLWNSLLLTKEPINEITSWIIKQYDRANMVEEWDGIRVLFEQITHNPENYPNIDKSVKEDCTFALHTLENKNKEYTKLGQNIVVRYFWWQQARNFWRNFWFISNGRLEKESREKYWKNFFNNDTLKEESSKYEQPITWTICLDSHYNCTLKYQIDLKESYQDPIDRKKIVNAYVNALDSLFNQLPKPAEDQLPKPTESRWFPFLLSWR